MRTPSATRDPGMQQRSRNKEMSRRPFWRGIMVEKFRADDNSAPDNGLEIRADDNSGEDKRFRIVHTTILERVMV